MGAYLAEMAGVEGVSESNIAEYMSGNKNAINELDAQKLENFAKSLGFDSFEEYAKSMQENLE
jgi:transcriptional regulator with XRE-family HTH domain